MAYFESYNHFVNTVFTIIRDHSIKGAEYDTTQFIVQPQLIQIWNDFNPSTFTWALKQHYILAYARDVDVWMWDQNDHAKINLKRDILMNKEIKTEKDKR